MRGYLLYSGVDILERQPIRTFEAGDTVEFWTPLEAGESYRLLFDAAKDDREYVRGRAEVEFPIENELLAVTHGLYSWDTEDRSDRYRYNVDQIKPILEPYDPPRAV